MNGNTEMAELGPESKLCPLPFRVEMFLLNSCETLTASKCPDQKLIL